MPSHFDRSSQRDISQESSTGKIERRDVQDYRNEFRIKNSPPVSTADLSKSVKEDEGSLPPTDLEKSQESLQDTQKSGQGISSSKAERRIHKKIKKLEIKIQEEQIKDLMKALSGIEEERSQIINSVRESFSLPDDSISSPTKMRQALEEKRDQGPRDLETNCDRIKSNLAYYGERLSGSADIYDPSKFTHELITHEISDDTEYARTNNLANMAYKRINTVIVALEKNLDLLKQNMNSGNFTDVTTAKDLYRERVKLCSDALKLDKMQKSFRYGLAVYCIKRINTIPELDQRINKINQEIENLPAVTEFSSSAIQELQAELRELNDSITDKKILPQSSSKAESREQEGQLPINPNEISDVVVQPSDSLRRPRGPEQEEEEEARLENYQQTSPGDTQRESSPKDITQALDEEKSKVSPKALVERIKAKIEGQLTEIRRLESEKEKAEKENNDILNKLQTLDLENKSIKDEKKQIADKQIEMNKELKALRDKIEESKTLEQTERSLQKRVTQLEQTERSLQKRVTQLEQTERSLQDQLKQLSEQHEKAKETIAEIKSKHDLKYQELSIKNDRLETDFSAEKSKVSTLEQHLQQVTEKHQKALKDQESENQRLAAEVQRLESERNAEKARADALTRHFQEAEGQRRQEIQVLHEHLRNYQRQLYQRQDPYNYYYSPSSWQG